MEPSLKKFKETFGERVQNFLWREWTALGVAGLEQAPVRHVIDPEALLLFTCSLGRYDQRLFDEMLDWLTVNGRFLNVQRMKNILRRESFGGERVLTALADWLSRRAKPAKWKLLARTGTPPCKTESLFFLPDGGPAPDITDRDPVFLEHEFLRNNIMLRGYSRTFPAESPACHLLKMRALFGVTARCDALAYLTMKRTGHPREIAREMYYSQKAIHEVMTDLAVSGVLHSVKCGRERIFRITTQGLPLLTGDNEPVGWINWPVLLSAAERVWKTVEDSKETDADSLFETAEITLSLKPLLERIFQMPRTPAPPTLKNRQGISLLETFMHIFETLAE